MRTTAVKHARASAALVRRMAALLSLGSVLQSDGVTDAWSLALASLKRRLTGLWAALAAQLARKMDHGQ